MNKLVNIVTIFILSTQVALAGQVTAIQKGAPAPYEGVLFDIEAANDLRKKDLDFSFGQKQNEYLTKENGLLNQRVDLAQKEIQHLNDKNSSFLGVSGGFIGGVITTVLITFAVSKVSK